MPAPETSAPTENVDRPGRLKITGIYGGSILLAAIGLVVAIQFVQPAPPRSIRIATGNPDGAYHRFAEQYRVGLARRGIDLQLEPSDGSVDNLRRILGRENPPDLAFIQSGVANPEQREQLAGLGSVGYEPLWLFVRTGQAPPALHRLSGEAVDAGLEGSGSRFLALSILRASGVAPANIAPPAETLEEAADRLVAGDVDLVFAVANPDSPALHGVAGDPGIELQSLPRAAAFARRDPALSLLDLPEGTLDPARDLPSKDLELVAATANLVAHPDIHPALVDLLIQTAGEVHGDGSLFAPPDTFPHPHLTDFPLHPDARRHYKNGPPFLQRYLPFWIASWVDRTKVMLLPLLALLFPLFKILPPAYRWRIRRRITRWYIQLRRIDREASQPDLAGDVLAQLKGELKQIEEDTARIRLPLSYTDQLYNLRLHIQLLETKLERLGEHEKNSL